MYFNDGRLYEYAKKATGLHLWGACAKQVASREGKPYHIGLHGEHVNAAWMQHG